MIDEHEILDALRGTVAFRDGGDADWIVIHATVGAIKRLADRIAELESELAEHRGDGKHDHNFTYAAERDSLRKRIAEARYIVLTSYSKLIELDDDDGDRENYEESPAPNTAGGANLDSGSPAPVRPLATGDGKAGPTYDEMLAALSTPGEMAAADAMHVVDKDLEQQLAAAIADKECAADAAGDWNEQLRAANARIAMLDEENDLYRKRIRELEQHISAVTKERADIQSAAIRKDKELSAANARIAELELELKKLRGNLSEGD